MFNLNRIRSLNQIIEFINSFILKRTLIKKLITLVSRKLIIRNKGVEIIRSRIIKIKIWSERERIIVVKWVI